MGDMALDDVALTLGACGAELSCSFEAGACGLAGSGQWHWQSGGTGTGPMADHTTGTTTGTWGSGHTAACPARVAAALSPRPPAVWGLPTQTSAPQESQAWGNHSTGASFSPGHYMVVNTSKHSLPMGHVATLSSALYQRSAPAQCLAFWYQLSAAAPGEPCVPRAVSPTQHRLGILGRVSPLPWTCSTAPFSVALPRAGTLSVLVEENSEQRKLFSISAMEGDTWHRGHVTVRADTDWKVREVPRQLLVGWRLQEGPC